MCWPRPRSLASPPPASPPARSTKSPPSTSRSNWATSPRRRRPRPPRPPPLPRKRKRRPPCRLRRRRRVKWSRLLRPKPRQRHPPRRSRKLRRVRRCRRRWRPNQLFHRHRPLRHRRLKPLLLRPPCQLRLSRIRRRFLQPRRSHPQRRASRPLRPSRRPHRQFPPHPLCPRRRFHHCRRHRPSRPSPASAKRWVSSIWAAWVPAPGRPSGARRRLRPSPRRPVAANRRAVAMAVVPALRVAHRPPAGGAAPAPAARHRLVLLPLPKRPPVRKSPYGRRSLCANWRKRWARSPSR